MKKKKKGKRFLAGCIEVIALLLAAGVAFLSAAIVGFILSDPPLVARLAEQEQDKSFWPIVAIWVMIPTGIFALGVDLYVKKVKRHSTFLRKYGFLCKNKFFEAG